jgi:adenylate cyclase
MSDTAPSPAWLENEAGEQLPLGPSFAIGRSSTCDLMLQDSKVSRKHVVINRQAGDEFWLSDLGSANGTYVNQLRVSQPVRLRPGDEIRIGPFQLRFRRLSAEPAVEPTQVTTQQTIIDLRHELRWLLVADIENSTLLASSLEPALYRRHVDEWFTRSKEVIARQRGAVNKFLGDGFLACWPAREGMADHVAAALAQFQAMRDAHAFRFRVVLHLGDILLGGVGHTGEESLAGPEVNFAFRMEKVAGTNGLSILVSEPAAAALGERLPPGEVRCFEVPGFAGTHHFYAV